MSEKLDVTQSKEHALKKRIKTIIDQEYGEIPLPKIVLTLEELVSDYDKLARQERSSVGMQSSSSSVAEDSSKKQAPSSSMGLFSSDGTSAQDMAEIGVVAESDVQLAQLLNQIVNIGALMLQVDEPLDLNEQVSLVVEYPSADFSMAVIGRVVNISSRGTALEITRLSRDDRAALEQMYRHYQHYLQPVTASESQAKAPAPSSRAPEVPPRKPQPKPAVPRQTMPLVNPNVSPSATSTGSTLTDGSPFSRMRSTVNDVRMTMRRQVSLIQPDEKVITSSNLAEEEAQHTTGVMTEEFYGPQNPWVDLNMEPDRVEQLVSDRVMDILLQLSGHHFSGLVELEHKSASGKPILWRLSFDSGFLVDAMRQPRQARVELGHMLLLAGRVEKLHLSMAAAHAEEQEQQLEQSLLDLELIEPTVLRHAIAGRLTFLLRLLSNIDDGVIRIYEDQKLPPGFLPMPTLRVHVAIERTIFQLIYESLRQLPGAERNEMSASELDTYPETISEEYERIERAIGEENQELAGLAGKLVHGRRRLREVFTESTMASADTFAVIFALHRMGLLRFDRSLHHTVVRERFRENVTVKYLSVHKASYFEVLNVHWSSYDSVVKVAYEELLEQFDPDEMPEGLEQEVLTRVHEIRERVKSAYQVLAHREHRHAYRTRIMPEYKLAHAIPLFMKQAELAERRQQWDEARDGVLRVLEIDPAHKEAKARLIQIDAQLKGLSDHSSMI